MAVCINCGSEIHDRAAICPCCGVAQKDNGGFGWGLLGCCFPLVGLILFLIWKDQKPKTAKAAGVGALVGVGIWIAFYLISFVGGILAAVAEGV